jgi:hypothetical protein
MPLHIICSTISSNLSSHLCDREDSMDVDFLVIVSSCCIIFSGILVAFILLDCFPFITMSEHFSMNCYMRCLSFSILVILSSNSNTNSFFESGFFSTTVEVPPLSATITFWRGVGFSRLNIAHHICDTHG